MHRSLNPQKIVETADKLEKRIAERFPTAGLRQVASELHAISEECVVRSARIRTPNYLLRLVITLLVCAILALLAFSVITVRYRIETPNVIDLIQALEGALGSIVFIGAAIVFLASLETRWKRRRALQAIHELRALAHIVDMHQLTKDPDRILRGPSTPSSPQRTMTPFLLCRYLDYCTELLSVTSKIAALYVQDFPDSDTLAAVDQVENLTSGLSRKIWQKIVILDQMIEKEQAQVEPNMPVEAPAS